MVVNRAELERLTIKDLRQQFPGAPTQLKKAALIDAIINAAERQARRQHWEQEVLAQGYPRVLAAINALRTQLNLGAISQLVPHLDPIGEALTRGTTFQSYVSPGYIHISDNNNIIAETLLDEWGYEFIVRLTRGIYQEWSIIAS